MKRWSERHTELFSRFSFSVAQTPVEFKGKEYLIFTVEYMNILATLLLSSSTPVKVRCLTTGLAEEFFGQDLVELAKAAQAHFTEWHVAYVRLWEQLMRNEEGTNLEAGWPDNNRAKTFGME